VTVRTPDLDAVAALITGPGQDDLPAPSAATACDEVSSLEVRWIFPGELEPAVAAWFRRFPATTESREDAYRMNPRLRGLSVKIRGDAALQVKSYLGSQGILEVPGRARGHMQAWRKWSFPISLPGPGRGVPAGWRRVRKTRRLSRLVLASDEIVACSPELRQEPGCDVELTEISAQGENWWSLGFEATGPSGLLRGELAATATLVFAQPVPAAEPGTDHFASYAQWLARVGGGSFEQG
jgi:hypothetical protein